jgi:multicomponent K+:H+ antiporter subunit E
MRGQRLDTISPTLVTSLTVLWLLLNQTLAAAQIVLGMALAIVLALASSRLRPLRATLRRFDLAAVLLGIVFVEIIKSNIAVARIVLGLARDREVRSGFLHIPLDLRDPHGLAALATIITATPGTVWAGLTEDGTRLTIHVLDLDDEQRWIAYIKERFETPLRRIFE